MADRETGDRLPRECGTCRNSIPVERGYTCPLSVLPDFEMPATAGRECSEHEACDVLPPDDQKQLQPDEGVRGAL